MIINNQDINDELKNDDVIEDVPNDENLETEIVNDNV